MPLVHNSDGMYRGPVKAEAIATRIIMPNERIVETTLVEKLGVSRVPIREALRPH